MCAELLIGFHFSALVDYRRSIPDVSIIFLFTIVADSNDVPILHETKRRILKELRTSRFHGYELAKRLNLPLTGIYQHLKELSDDRLIVPQDKGRRIVYSLTKRGEALLAILDNGTETKEAK